MGIDFKANKCYLVAPSYILFYGNIYGTFSTQRIYDKNDCIDFGCILMYI